jgi:hypothetical protein
VTSDEEQHAKTPLTTEPSCKDEVGKFINAVLTTKLETSDYRDLG